MLLGVEADTARKYAAAGKFDPTDLESIVAFWSSRQPKYEPYISDLVEVRLETTPIGVARDSFGPAMLVAP